MAENTTGFVTSGYIDKKGTAEGMDAKFNYLPPGQNIGNQKNADIAGTLDMTVKRIVPAGFPGDGH